MLCIPLEMNDYPCSFENMFMDVYYMLPWNFKVFGGPQLSFSNDMLQCVPDDRLFSVLMIEVVWHNSLMCSGKGVFGDFLWVMWTHLEKFHEHLSYFQYRTRFSSWCGCYTSSLHVFSLKLSYFQMSGVCGCSSLVFEAMKDVLD